MALSLRQFSSHFFSNKHELNPHSNSQLQGHDLTSKLDALEAVDILVTYKTTVHDFTDEIIEFWPLPKRIMDRYQFDDADQLNEWLESLS